MNIEDKLLLSARPGKLTLIREGLFLRCYQGFEAQLYEIVR